MRQAATTDHTSRQAQAQELGIGSFFTRLTDAQCERLHEATLQVLERTGLIVDEPEALELLHRRRRRRGRHARAHPARSWWSARSRARRAR